MWVQHSVHPLHSRYSSHPPTAKPAKRVHCAKIDELVCNGLLTNSVRGK